MKWLTVPIAGQKWRVDLVKGNHPIFEGDKCHGMTVNDKCRIYLAREFDETARQSTLIHELLGHAAFYVSGVHQKILELCENDEDKAEEVEEEIVRKLELVWNPMFEHFSWRFPKSP